MLAKKKSILLLILLLLSGGTLWVWADKWGKVITDNAYIQGEITQVSAEVGGRVVKVLIHDNQYVKAGQILAELDNRDYVARQQQATANLSAAQAAIVNNRAKVELQQVKIQQADAEMNRASANNELQQREHARYARLVQSGAVSQSQNDTQSSKARQGSAELSSARFRLNAEKQQLAILNSEYQQLQAQLRQAEATLVLAEKALADTRIMAPISGIVGNRALQEGKYVSGGTGVLAIVPTDNIWLVANYKETQLTKVRPGQQVRVVLDMFPDAQMTGKVLSLSPSTGARFSLLPPDNATGNFVKIVQRVPVKIALEIPKALQGRIVPGLSAKAVIDTSTNGS